MDQTIRENSAQNQHPQSAEELKHWVNQFRAFTGEGACAGYIPALQKADPTQLGACVIGADGTRLTAGNWEVPFTLQSVSKPISLLAVCLEHGIARVMERVDAEPTGDAFNSIIRLEMSKQTVQSDDQCRSH